MARRKKEIVVLENTELKPQTIGTIYKKETNIIRTLLIIAIFGFCVWNINEITEYINNLLNKPTASTIKDIINDNNNNENNDNNNNNESEVEYKEFATISKIELDELTIDNFNYNERTLTFDVNNNDTIKNYSDKNYYVELYTNTQTLITRLKLDIATINKGTKISYSFENVDEFYYIAFVEKKVEDYPEVTLTEDETGFAKLNCRKDVDSITYSFEKNELKEIKHIVTINDNTSDLYNRYYNTYKNKVSNYENLKGYTATFNENNNGFTAIIDIDLEEAKLDDSNEKYYYAYKEVPKVVKFEMETSGFTCR